jgi:hypothetical protein
MVNNTNQLVSAYSSESWIVPKGSSTMRNFD